MFEREEKKDYIPRSEEKLTYILFAQLQETHSVCKCVCVCDFYAYADNARESTVERTRLARCAASGTRRSLRE